MCVCVMVLLYIDFLICVFVCDEFGYVCVFVMDFVVGGDVVEDLMLIGKFGVFDCV